MIDLHSLSLSLYLSLSEGSIGDLDGGEENPPDDVSLSGEEGGVSDQDDSAECDGSSPSFAPLYNEGKIHITTLSKFTIIIIVKKKLILTDSSVVPLQLY